jgi:hypothetical protein
MAQTSDPRPDALIIGGHFSAIVDEYDFPPPGRYGYESARSCLYALIKTISPRRVHIPYYICDVVPEAIERAGCAIKSYSIDQSFGISGEIDFREGDLILIVNYYGLCAASIERQLEMLPREAVIVDNSQAYFQPPFCCLANIYSPRKFLPVPDGGFIETDAKLKAEPADEEASLQRFHYLLQRVGSPPQASRANYLTAEASLDRPTLREMSGMTRRLARASDHDFIAMRRRENFHAFAGLLRDNELYFDLGDQVPLSYPLMTKDGSEVRKFLMDKNIFTPVYWKNTESTDPFEIRLINDTIFLPVDHRYNAGDIAYICSILDEFVRSDL